MLGAALAILPLQYQALVAGLPKHQVAACKEVRKKGRNKQHAISCRTKKENDFKTLQVSIISLFFRYEFMNTLIFRKKWRKDARKLCNLKQNTPLF